MIQNYMPIYDLYKGFIKAIWIVFISFLWSCNRMDAGVKRPTSSTSSVGTSDQTFDDYRINETMNDNGHQAGAMKELAVAMGKLAVAMERQAAVMERQVVAMERPAVAMERPAVAMERPAVAMERPAGAMERPVGVMGRPAGAMERPAGVMGRPAGAIVERVQQLLRGRTTTLTSCKRNLQRGLGLGHTGVGQDLSNLNKDKELLNNIDVKTEKIGKQKAVASKEAAAQEQRFIGVLQDNRREGGASPSKLGLMDEIQAVTRKMGESPRNIRQSIKRLESNRGGS